MFNPLSYCKSLYRLTIPTKIRGMRWTLKEKIAESVWTKPFVIYFSSRDDREKRDAFLRLRLHIGKTIARTFANDMELFVDLRDQGIGRPLYIYREYEPTETLFLTKTLRPGMVFVDVGANIGYYTTLAAKIVGPSGRVIAIEPDLHNYGLLRRNIRRNRFRNCSLHNIALGASAGVVQIYASTVNYGDHRVYDGGDERLAKKVQIDTADSIFEREAIDHVDVLKMDVQGFEQKVLEGMQLTFNKSKNMIILSEFWPDGLRLAGGSPEDYLAIMRNADFRVSILSPDGEDCSITYSDIMDRVPVFDADKPDASYLNLVFRKP